MEPEIPISLPTTHHSAQSWLPIAISCIASLLVGLLLGQRLSTPTSIPVPTPLPTAIITPTPTWKTYSNSQYNFGINYPSDWIGPFKLSGTQLQGSASFQGSEGSLSLTWGGGFGGGPCPSEKKLVNTEIGEIGFCVSKGTDGSELFTEANEGPAPQNFPQVYITFGINSPIYKNEIVLNQILSTFRFSN